MYPKSTARISHPNILRHAPLDAFRPSKAPAPESVIRVELMEMDLRLRFFSHASFCIMFPLVGSCVHLSSCSIGKRDSIHHHLLEAISETAIVLESRQAASIHHPLWVAVVHRIGLPIDTPRWQWQAAASAARPVGGWILYRGGCSLRVVQWMGVVLYNKTACNIM